MTKRIRPLGNHVLLRVIEVEETTAGGIVLTSANREEAVHGVVLAKPEYSYHPNGQIRDSSLEVGDTVCFMKKSGTSVMEAPEGEKWLAVPEDCIYYKVEQNG